MDTKPDFEALLRSRGFRATQGRVELLETLWRSKRPLTVEQVGKRLNLNVVTLYRALASLAKEGLLMRGGEVGEAVHFSYPRGLHHHHLVCMDCGFIRTCANCN